MGDLYFIELPSKIVFVYSPCENCTWRLSRISPCQRAKLVWKILCLPPKEDENIGTWVLQDQSPGAKNTVIGRPTHAAQDTATESFPPLGSWRVGGFAFTLTNCMPDYPPPDPFPQVEVPFASLRYSEDGNIARLDTKMTSTPIEDDTLEDLLAKIQELVKNLGRRPKMVLMLRSDAQDAAVPSVKHIRRFLRFIEENGPELFLVGRGSAIILKPTGIVGHMLVSVIRMVQRMLPPPWPEVIVPTADDAEAFLAEHANQYLGPSGDAAETAAPTLPAAIDAQAKQPAAISAPEPQKAAAQPETSLEFEMVDVPREPSLTPPLRMTVWPNEAPRNRTAKDCAPVIYSL